MRFLCLHGKGTNSHVFQTQSATIRYEMDKHHVFDFVEGILDCPITSEIKDIFPSGDRYFRYFWNTPDSISTALEQLSAFVQAEGPFDGVLAFSQGAALAATYLIQYQQQHAGAPLPFRCAIFLSGVRPFDPPALQEGVMRLSEPGVALQAPIRLPTAHIWGQNDALYAAHSEILAEHCEASVRVTYVHSGRHEVPGPRAQEDVQGSLRAIRRTIDRAEAEV